MLKIIDMRTGEVVGTVVDHQKPKEESPEQVARKAYNAAIEAKGGHKAWWPTFDTISEDARSRWILGAVVSIREKRPMHPRCLSCGRGLTSGVCPGCPT